MPAILRGTLDDALEYFNEGADDGGSFFEVSLVDPMPEAIRVWEKYNRWCIGISRGGGGERISETALQQLDRDAVDLFYDIGRTFPLKHGAKDEDKAWNILKGHNLLYHMTDSARMPRHPTFSSCDSLVPAFAFGGKNRSRDVTSVSVEKLMTSPVDSRRRRSPPPIFGRT